MSRIVCKGRKTFYKTAVCLYFLRFRYCSSSSKKSSVSYWREIYVQRKKHVQGPLTGGKTRKRSFNPDWFAKHPWSKTTDNEGMICDICKKASANNPFMTNEGCKNWQNSTLSRHHESHDHCLSVQKLELRANMQDGDVPRSTSYEPLIRFARVSRHVTDFNAELPVQVPDVNLNSVYANNEICLEDIEVYGFDYDYTLATYKQDLHHVLYDLGRDALVTKYKYPEGIGEMNFNPEFAIRGLHYDIRKGLLMKIDSFHNIQLGTVYRGTTQLSDSEVMAQYDGTHVPLQDMNTFYGTGPMHQLVDMFAPPEMNLITNVTDYFIANNIPYDPEYVFYDIRNAVQGVHYTGQIHEKIVENLGQYLEKGEETKSLLQRLVAAGKKLFLISNSGFRFIDAGMKYMVGDDWADLFEVIVVRARKPKFFNEASRPFRIYDPSSHEETWERVRNLVKGKVYLQGNYSNFREMTGWYGSKVLYLGDHVYTDLADPSLKHGWRTGAIIPELEAEVKTIFSVEYNSSIRWLSVLQHLLEEIQADSSPEITAFIVELLEERTLLRNQLKSLCNPRFGSMFRTHQNPTYFSRRMARFADIYMSSLTNLLQYSVTHTFYPRRMALPHEPFPFGDPSHASCVPPDS